MLLLGLLLAPATGSAQVTLGTDPATASATSAGCSPYSTCTYAQSVPGAGAVAVAPANGVVVGWRVRGSGTMRLRVLRLLSGTRYTGSGSSATASVASGSVASFATRLPIKSGDIIGITMTTGTSSVQTVAPSGAALLRFSGTIVPDGASRTGTALAGNAVLLQADIELDGDVDGYGDETQDLCPRDVTRQTSCSADVSISRAQTPTVAMVDDPVTHIFNVSNAGTSPASSVAVSYAVPGNAALVSATPTSGGCSGGGVVTCALGDLSKGASATVTIVVNPLRAGSVPAAASVSTMTSDPNGHNNSAGATTTVLKPGACANGAGGTTGPDSLRGGRGGDAIWAHGGDDRVDGASGYDCLYGEQGNDTLDGSSGSDRLVGGPGNDTLIGGEAADRFEGGPGDDRIDTADGVREMIYCGPGNDTVTADRIDVLPSTRGKKRLRGRRGRARQRARARAARERCESVTRVN